MKREAVRFRVRGLVQGVGFRPFVYRLAQECGLAGWITNDHDGVLIHVEGDPARIGRFHEGLSGTPPPAARLDSLDRQPGAWTGLTGFRIRPSPDTDQPVERVRVPTERAICTECLQDILAPGNRRQSYPLTTCTQCGPRYSILSRLPYDRPNTTMASFALCDHCRAEYEDPGSRRFHAQPISCLGCGPQVAWWDATGREQARGGDAIRLAAEALRQGRIVALKGLGGFQLLSRADCSETVSRLRQRKHRSGKPLAVMVPSLGMAEQLARVDDLERQALVGAANPIVLLPARPGAIGPGKALAPEIAPGMSHVGLMLPTTPLHHLLLEEFPFPMVATSGNQSEDPIVIDERQALAELAGIADAYLVHDRPIRHRVDDSVVRIIADRTTAIRLARGYAPLPLPALERLARRFEHASRVAILATGPQQKVAPALWTGTQAVLAPHVGDLDSPLTREAWVRLTRDFAALYRCEVAKLVCDQHPDYFTTRWAQAQPNPLVQVQHHHAHAVACMVEHDLLDQKVLALTWDGTGYGPDETIWGGEVLLARIDGWERVASLRPFPLPGGEAAIHHPNRVALGLLLLTLGEDAVLQDALLLERLRIPTKQAYLLARMVQGGVQTVWSTSMGRLFDAVAALVLGIDQATYEGEAAVRLEAEVDPDLRNQWSAASGQHMVARDSVAGLRPSRDSVAGVASEQRWGDWQGLMRALVSDVRSGVAASVSATWFHDALAEWAAEVAAGHPGLDVVLSGGCFQNGYLTTQTTRAIAQLGHRVWCHGEVPPNDGGLAAGQLAVGMHRFLTSGSGRTDDLPR